MPDSPASSPTTPGEQRLGQLSGDRRCHACWFNLRGQIIVREPHYAMVMVRCPECGTPAPLMEYPRLGPWGRRLGMAAALAYLGLVIGLLLGVGGVLTGMADLAASEAVAPLGRQISTEFIAWAKAQPAVAGASGNPYTWMIQNGASSDGWIDSKWWSTVDRAALVASVPSPHRPFAPGVAYTWLVACLPLMPMSSVLGCLLTHLRGRRLLVIPAVGAALAAAFTALGMAESGGKPQIHTADAAALSVLGVGVVALQLVMVCLPVIVGSLAGRPVARGLVRWLVPPRQWAHFGFLWAADRRPMPVPPAS